MHMPHIERQSRYLDENPMRAYYCEKPLLECGAVASSRSDRVITCLSVGVSRKSTVPRALEGFRFVESLIVICAEFSLKLNPEVINGYNNSAALQTQSCLI